MAAARYTVEHETLYRYAGTVSHSWQLAHLLPRRLPWQRLLAHAIDIDPPPDESHERVDSFGNTVTHFALHRAHARLRVTMRCAVEVGERPDPYAAEAAAQAGAAPPARAGAGGRADAGGPPPPAEPVADMPSAFDGSIGADDGPAAAADAAAPGARPAAAPPPAPAIETWESVRDGVRRGPAQDGLAPARLAEPTRLVPLSRPPAPTPPPSCVPAAAGWRR